MIGTEDPQTIPHLVFFAFQATFCIITVALISGAVVERMRFSAFLVFAALWSVLVYAVLAHWAFGGGWLFERGTLDFAGGVAVEMASGFSALAAALVVGARKDYGRQALLPHNASTSWSAPACCGSAGSGSTAAAASAPTRAASRVHEHAADPGLRTARLVRARRDPRPQGHGDRRGDGDHRRLRADHPGRRLTSAPAGRWCSAPPARSPATRWSPTGRARAWTRRSTCSPRTASPASPESCSSALSHRSAGTAISRRARCTVTPTSSATRRSPRSQRPLYAFVVTFILLKLIGPVMPLRASEQDESIGMDVTYHGEEAYPTGEGAILVSRTSRPMCQRRRAESASPSVGGARWRTPGISSGCKQPLLRRERSCAPSLCRNRAPVVCSRMRRQAEPSGGSSSSTVSITFLTRRAEISSPWRAAISL